MAVYRNVWMALGYQSRTTLTSLKSLLSVCVSAVSAALLSSASVPAAELLSADCLPHPVTDATHMVAANNIANTLCFISLILSDIKYFLSNA